jgi:hypothetical protein
MRSLALVLVLTTGCATHRAARTTLIVGTVITALGIVSAGLCADYASRPADAPNDALLYCPLALGLVTAGGGTQLAGGISLALPEDPPDAGSGSATARP